MAKFTTVNLSRCFNAPAKLNVRRSRKAARWSKAAEEVHKGLLRGRKSCWGIPFALGPKNPAAKGLIVLWPKAAQVDVPLKGTATHVCFLHFSDRPADALDRASGGEHVADYVLRYKDGREHVQPIRRRFQINPFSGPWGEGAFAAMPAGMPAPVGPQQHGNWGWYQTGVTTQPGGGACVYALENPHPQKELASVSLRLSGQLPVAVLGITLYDGPGHPLRHVPRRVYRLVLPAGERTTVKDLAVQLDLGVITRLYAVPDRVDEAWLNSEAAGLGVERKKDTPRNDFLLEATVAAGATLKVKARGKKQHEIPIGEAYDKQAANSTDGRARVELLQPSTTWLYVTVVDGETGQPTPTRIHFRGRHGEYLPPYGHHAVVNDNWFEDYGGDLQLGGQSFAYVPGRFQIGLPVGQVFVEACKGFEYTPLRQALQIRPGQRELQLTIPRWANWRKQGWVTADTHVHFISPQTAWLEGQGEGLNLVNLLASQWGRLFTNAADITGALSGCSSSDTLVWVGTENRHHLLGHISMLGTRGDPVFPMCDGGPGEAFIGDPDMTLLTEWAQKCREREGVVIRPHFPSPVCEEPAYFVLKQLDGVELRAFADPAAETLDSFNAKEWYRYLNCGYRVAVVGGTDKMSAGMPVGGVRTYARIDPNEPFAFENWGKAVRRGATFTSSGPLIELTVEGRAVGEEIQMPAGGGTVQVEAKAQSAWPLHKLEVVAGGRVVASTASAKGEKSLHLKSAVKIERSTWLAARCGSRQIVHHCWPIPMGAHTSPVYVIVGGQELFSPSDATYMLTLLDGGMTYLDTLSVRYNEERHRQMKAILEKARAQLEQRLRGA